MPGAPEKCSQAEEFGEVWKAKDRKSEDENNPERRKDDHYKEPLKQTSSKPNSLFSFRKEKPICKNRTLYFQRKVLHVPRGKE
jgi:hypothetical protein